MSNDSSFNDFQHAIVLKATIDGGIKISNKDGKTQHHLEILQCEFPDVLLEVYHNNHKYFAEHGITKFKITLNEVTEPIALIAAMLPGTIIEKLTLDPKRGLIVQVKGKETLFQIRRYAAKHLAR